MSNLINNCSLNLVLIQNLLTHHKEATGFTDNIEEIYENVYHPKNITLASTKIHLYSNIEKYKMTQDNMNTYLCYSRCRYILGYILYHSGQSVCYTGNHSHSDHYSCSCSHIHNYRHIL